MDQESVEKLSRQILDSSMDRGSIEILLSTNSQQINLSRCCRESVDGKSTLMDQTTVEKLSARQNFLDGSRICQEVIETNSK